VHLVYFASVREAIGIDGEVRDIPASVTTVGACLDWLREQGGPYQAAFAYPAKLRFALDHVMAKADAALAGAEELAIFPPVTGG
jgi:sulfur-carrier protein